MCYRNKRRYKKGIKDEIIAIEILDVSKKFKINELFRLKIEKPSLALA